MKKYFEVCWKLFVGLSFRGFARRKVGQYESLDELRNKMSKE